jgi:hypothetical protein
MKLIAIATAILAGALIAGARAEVDEISARRTAERKTFTDDEITQGFLKTAFGAELRVSGQSDRIRKFDQPIRVFVDGNPRPDRRAAVNEVISDIGRRIRHLEISTISDRREANVVVNLVRDRDLPRAIRRLYGAERARQIQRSLAPQCMSGFRKDETFRIEHSDVIVVVDAGEFIFYDCIYEELLQALGPINDTDAVPWTMFNDNVHMGFFDIYDQYIMNILYDPRIAPGMDAEQVKALLPQVLPDVRAWVDRNNNLTP